MTVQELKSAFETAYGEAAEAVYFSPGRVNLIGEHTDYNSTRMETLLHRYNRYVHQ